MLQRTCFGGTLKERIAGRRLRKGKGGKSVGDSLALELLRDGDWHEDAPMVSAFLSSPWFPLLEEALTSLDKACLYRSHVHGVGHIERTMVHGAMCAWAEQLNEADSRLLLTMCAYHDTGRICDYLDGSHGKRSAEKLASLTGLSGEDLREAMAGIEAHSVPDRLMEGILASHAPEDMLRARMLAQMLKDSDGLDRVRIDDLDVNYLRRAPSRERGRFAQTLFDRYVALEQARGLNSEDDGYDLPAIRRVRAFLSRRFEAGDGCVEASLRSWDEWTGERIADKLIGQIGEGETCGVLTAAQRYFGELFARQGREAEEIREKNRAFARRFREQYGSDRCADLRPKSGCSGFVVDSVLFALQYLYK